MPLLDPLRGLHSLHLRQSEKTRRIYEIEKKTILENFLLASFLLAAPCAIGSSENKRVTELKRSIFSTAAQNNQIPHIFV